MTQYRRIQRIKARLEAAQQSPRRLTDAEYWSEVRWCERLGLPIPDREELFYTVASAA